MLLFPKNLHKKTDRLEYVNFLYLIKWDGNIILNLLFRLLLFNQIFVYITNIQFGFRF